MKRHLKILLLVILSVTGFNAFASSDDTALIGTWKGTSICQIKPSPCNDEIAVYHITKGSKAGTFHVVANKVIDGKEEDMGVSDYTFNAADNSFTSYIAEYKVSIKFIVKGNSMEGTLMRDKTVYRIIKLQKTSSN